MNMQDLKKSVLEEEILKEFDEKFVASNVGKVYNWKSTALSQCSDVRNFLSTAIDKSFEAGRQQALGEVRD